MVLLVDNYDSFTYNLFDYIRRAGYECVVKQYHELDLQAVRLHHYQAIVISPGPGKPEDYPNLFELLDLIVQQKLPLLGVCLGHQLIGTFFGMKISYNQEPVHGKVHWVKHYGGELFYKVPFFFKVTRYHSLCLEKSGGYPSYLNITCSSVKDNCIMGLQHEFLPISGIQFHPEAWLTEAGLQIIKNWLTLSAEKNKIQSSNHLIY